MPAPMEGSNCVLVGVEPLTGPLQLTLKGGAASALMVCTSSSVQNGPAMAMLAGRLFHRWIGPCTLAQVVPVASVYWHTR